MHPLRIAVIGSGISGLSAAWLLDKHHDVTLIEADNRIGGHTNTVLMDIDGKKVPVDTGFICFNRFTYPNLTAFFDYLDVAVHDTSMSFAASLDNGRYEYSGGTYTGMIGQPSNIFKVHHWRMIRDILRFFREAPKSLDTLGDDETLAQYLQREAYSKEFAEHHLMPMAAAIWSSKLDDMWDYPAKAFIRFFRNHGLLQVDGRPKWGTVLGGSQNYVTKLLEDSNLTIQTNAPVKKIERRPTGVVIHTANGEPQTFDQVVIASHADQALAMLDTPSAEEQALLGSFDYEHNRAILHRDRRYMPKRKLVWASWNYLDFKSQTGTSKDLCLTYWMNSLQHLETDQDVFVTLNPPKDSQIDQVAAEFDYAHPVFDTKAMQAQRELWSLQGANRTWYCGAHFGAGFHEDGLQSGLAVAEQLGGSRRPWNVENESGRIYLPKLAGGLRELGEAAE